MKNLKRVLSLALSGIMLVGMMAVGASAVDTRDFTDQDEIQHTDAVNTMAALNIITGNPDGSYAPERTVTREEMAKMITVALNGGKDFTYGTKATPSYTDIKGTWAESYIEYCSSLGIIGGNGDGTFAPKAPVTGSAAAKMMLTAMGYDAAQAGMVGTPDWEINTNILAGQKDLYKDLETINPSAPLSRDSAAQLIYNGVWATMVEYTYNAQTVNGTLTMVPTVKEKTHFVNGTEVKTTILTEKFGMSEAEGILTSVDYIEAAGKEPEKFVYTVNLDDMLVNTYSYTDKDGNPATGYYDTITFKADAADFSALLGEKVNALYKTVNGEQVLYGIYSKSDAVATFSQGQIGRKDDGTIDGTKKSIKADGITYSLTGTASAVKYYTYDSASGNLVAGNEINDLHTDVDPVSAVKLVCNTATGKYEYAIVTPSKVAKITYKSASSVTMNNGVGAYDLDDVTIYDGAKKDDFVIFTSDAYTVRGVADIAETETISGKVEAKRNTTDIRVNGTWYAKGGTATTPDINAEVTLVVVGGYYYDADATSESTVDDILFVAEAGALTSGLTDGFEVSAVFADGSVQTVRVTKVGGKDASVKGADISKYAEDNTIVEGAMYVFDKKSNGTYELTLLEEADNKRAGFEEFLTGTTAYDYTTNNKKPTVAGNPIADDAVVFVRSTATNNKKTQVITGAQLKDWAADWGDSAQVLSKAVRGNMTAQVVALYADEALPNTQGSKGYGMLLANAWYEKIDGTHYAHVSIFNGEEDIDVLAEKVYNDADSDSDPTNDFIDPAPGNVSGTGAMAAFKKGAFVEYETLKDGNITNLKVVGAAAALTGIYTDKDGDTTLTFEEDAYTGGSASVDGLITNKTQVIYVDTANTKGASGDNFELATETAIEEYWIKNVVYAYTTVSGGENRLDVVFVDVANNLSTNSSNKTATIGSNYTAAEVDGTTFYTGTTSIDAGDVAVTAAANDKVAFVNALAITVTDSTGAAKTGNLANDDVITVVAHDGSTISLIVKTGAKPA